MNWYYAAALALLIGVPVGVTAVLETERVTRALDWVGATILISSVVIGGVAMALLVATGAGAWSD